MSSTIANAQAMAALNQQVVDLTSGLEGFIPGLQAAVASLQARLNTAAASFIALQSQLDAVTQTNMGALGTVTQNIINQATTAIADLDTILAPQIVGLIAPG